VYVGDHIGDMRGARTASAYAVGVTSGPCDAPQLRAAGAAHAHTARNRTRKPLRLTVFYVLSAGSPLSRSIPAPECDPDRR
jgi:hypothetical protein